MINIKIKSTTSFSRILLNMMLDNYVNQINQGVNKNSAQTQVIQALKDIINIKIMIDDGTGFKQAVLEKEG